MLPSNQQNCIGCDAEFIPYNNRTDVLYCSYLCQQTHITKKRREERALAFQLLKIFCPWCQSEFSPKSSRQVYCSSKCQENFKAAKKTQKVERCQKPCEECGEPFYGPSKKSKYCSPVCRHDGRRKKIVKSPTKERSEQRKKNNQSTLRYRLKNWYGITDEYYYQMLKSQDNKCYICPREFDEFNKPNVDHAHDSTGKVRALLCGDCNKGLGLFKDNADRMRRASRYIDLHHPPENQLNIC
jgi:hypothetical protein